MSIKVMELVWSAHFQDITITDSKGKKRTVIAPNAKSVCLAMADSANDEGEGSYNGVARLSDKTDLSENTVVAALKALKSVKIVAYVGISRLGTNNYTVNKAMLADMAKWEKRKGKVPAGRITPNAKQEYPVETVSTQEKNRVETVSTPELKPLQHPVETTSIDPSNVNQPSLAVAKNSDRDPKVAQIVQSANKTVDAILGFEKIAQSMTEIQKRLPDYPEDVQPLLKKIAERFSFPTIPAKTRKGGGTFGMWIKELRYIRSELLNGNWFEPIEWAYQANLKNPREISHPGALNSLIFNVIREHKAVEAQQAQSQKRNQQEQPLDTIPAPAWVQFS